MNNGARIMAAVLLCLLMALPALSQAETRKVSVQGLLYDLKHPDPDRREAAARLLGSNKIRQAVPDLVTAAADPEEKVRLAVVTALEEIRDPQALPAYVALMSDSSATIRGKAIDGLVQLYVLDEQGFIAGSKKVLNFLNPFDSNYNALLVEPYVAVAPEGVTALAARLDDSDYDVRKAAVMALGILRGQTALPRMMEVLPSEPENTIKVEFLRSFFKIGGAAACSAIVPLVNDPDKSVHDEAILTAGLLRCLEAAAPIAELYESGIKERRTVLGVVPASSKDDLQIKCLQSLALIAHPDSEKLFLPALRHVNESYRVAAADGLARLANPAHLPQVEEQRKAAKGRPFQLALAFAAYRMGQKEQLREVVDELDSSRYGDQVFGYLVELRPDALVDLYPYLRGEKGKTRIRLLDILGLAGTGLQLQEIQQYTHDSDADVASAALQAIRRIQARDAAVR